MGALGKENKDLTGVAIGISVLINVIGTFFFPRLLMVSGKEYGPAIIYGDYKNIWVYILSPILGAVSARILYKFLEVTKPAKPEPWHCNICNHNHLPFF
ncbi:hypothetical protein VNO78_31026 [Psophocarpus tetragonolobus]|uniref:Uncharacterized protein n=1 Tax=Psophocarpus tetragonolobus TaxID=3891 RepID=A0AAN9RY77_PSOTE